MTTLYEGRQENYAPNKPVKGKTYCHLTEKAEIGMAWKYFVLNITPQPQSKIKEKKHDKAASSLLKHWTRSRVFPHIVPAGETWGQLLIFSSFRVSLLLATSTFRDGSSTGVSSIFSEDNDLELTNTTVRAEMKWDCGRTKMIQWIKMCSQDLLKWLPGWQVSSLNVHSLIYIWNGKSKLCNTPTLHF